MKQTFILIGIIIIASILRLYQLGQVPISPDWDEVALGYNAYSILKTGRDEYGTFLPLSIRSFDDYKPPLYTYLTVPSVALFDLTVWSVRLPSAIMGIFAVLGTFFLVRELFRKSTINYQLSIFSSFLLAISPWHIQFSRIAFEANTGITLNIWAVATFLIGLRKKYFFPISAILFGLGMYAYHSERIFLPLLVLLLGVIFRKEVFHKENIGSIITAILIGLLVVAPLATVFANKSSMSRAYGTSIFSNPTNLLARSISSIEYDQKLGDKIGQLFDNRRFVWTQTLLFGYLSHFSMKWLFLTGDNPRHHAPDMGLLYLWELPFILYGLYTIIKSKDQKTKCIIIGWLLISPIAASPTTGLPHAIRTLVFLPMYQIICAIGIVHALSYMKKVYSLYFRLFVYWIIGLLVIFNMLYYLNMYFVQQNYEFSEFWQYGYKQAVEYTEKVKQKYKKVVVSTKLEQSYMFFLFYSKYDPQKYLASGGTKSGGFREDRNTFDIYEFRDINWSSEQRNGDILYVGTLQDMPHGNLLNIPYLNGQPAIEIADQPNGAP